MNASYFLHIFLSGHPDIISIFENNDVELWTHYNGYEILCTRGIKASLNIWGYGDITWETYDGEHCELVFPIRTHLYYRYKIGSLL